MTGLSHSAYLAKQVRRLKHAIFGATKNTIAVPLAHYDDRRGVATKRCPARPAITISADASQSTGRPIGLVFDPLANRG